MSKFEIKPTEKKITKEILLAANPAEKYFEHYLGIPVKKGLFVCPPCLRSDNKPTCSFYKNKKGDLILKDFAGESYGFINVVMHIFQCSYYKALKIIANDFGLIVAPKLEKNQQKIEYSNTILKENERAKIQVETKDFSEKELKWWGSYAISKNTLNKFRVYSIKHVFLNGNYFGSSSESSPMYGYYGGLDSDGNELWRIYMPTKIKYRFLSNWTGLMIQGAKQLKVNDTELVVTKSLKDVMALYEFGITAIAPCSENSFLTKSQYNKLKNKFKNIYLLYDYDLPGIRAAKKIKKEFPDIIVQLIPRKYRCKDFTDFVKKYDLMKVFNLIDLWREQKK